MNERYQRMVATIQDILLIDNAVLVIFWAEAMDTSNYLQNKLSIKYFKCTPILKEALTRNKKDIQYFQIFGYKASIFIPNEQCIKSNIHKTWKMIFIGNIDTNKYIQV